MRFEIFLVSYYEKTTRKHTYHYEFASQNWFCCISYVLIYCAFFCFMIFFYFLFDSLSHWCSGVHCSVTTHCDFSSFLPNFYFQTVVVGKDIWCYFSLLKFASTCFVTCVISPGEGSMCPWMHILLLLNGMHYICLLGSIKVSFKSIISLLIFSLDYISLWIILLKVPYYYCIVGISPLIFVNNYLVYSGATKLGVYISVSIVSTWWIDPFIIIWWPSLSHPWWVKW